MTVRLANCGWFGWTDITPAWCHYINTCMWGTVTYRILSTPLDLTVWVYMTAARAPKPPPHHYSWLYRNTFDDFTRCLYVAACCSQTLQAEAHFTRESVCAHCSHFQIQISLFAKGLTSAQTIQYVELLCCMFMCSPCRLDVVSWRTRGRSLFLKAPTVHPVCSMGTERKAKYYFYSDLT